MRTQYLPGGGHCSFHINVVLSPDQEGLASHLRYIRRMADVEHRIKVQPVCLGVLEVARAICSLQEHEDAYAGIPVLYFPRQLRQLVEYTVRCGQANGTKSVFLDQRKYQLLIYSDQIVYDFPSSPLICVSGFTRLYSCRCTPTYPRGWPTILPPPLASVYRYPPPIPCCRCWQGLAVHCRPARAGHQVMLIRAKLEAMEPL